MAEEPYLVRLTTHLLEGAGQLPASIRQRHSEYLRRLQQTDGGFPDREGNSDLYYTGFALRGLAILESLTPEICERAGQFLLSRSNSQTGVADFFSFLYSAVLIQLGGGPDVFAAAAPDWRERTAATFERLRAEDGGYRQRPDNANGSTYHTFLAALAMQLIGQPIPDPAAMRKFALSRRREDGGFVEAAPVRRSGTNPTAAGVGILAILDALDTELCRGVAEYLLQTPSDEGGLRANLRVPMADMLSTFTGLWTLSEIGQLDQVNTAAMMRFVEMCEVETGGFLAGLWDERPDAEYTFYALGTWAICLRAKGEA